MNYVIGGFFSLAIAFFVAGFAGSAANDSIQQKCLNAGRIVVNGNVYECKLVGKEIKP